MQLEERWERDGAGEPAPLRSLNPSVALVRGPRVPAGAYVPAWHYAHVLAPAGEGEVHSTDSAEGATMRGRRSPGLAMVSMISGSRFAGMLQMK